MRIEQFNRYFALAGESANTSTLEDTCCDQAIAPQPDHRHLDSWAETQAEGQRFASTSKNLEGARRRSQSRLAVSRTPTIEPLGASRERFYEQRLLLGLPWHCASAPSTRLAADGKVLVEWRFLWTPPAPELLGTQLEPLELIIAPDLAVSFETTCADIEKEFCRGVHGLVCLCCAGELPGQVCRSCKHAVGFHRCVNRHRPIEHLRWCKGTLFGGELDVQRAIYNLHRKCFPTEVGMLYNLGW